MLSLPKCLTFALSAIVFFISFLAFAAISSAQSIGVSITPAQIEETIDPGTSRDFTFTLQNLNESEQTFFFFTRNITGVIDGGTPVFAENNQEVTGYELADWITLESSSAVLAGGATQEVRFKMNVPQDASPGSHFGGVFISVDPPEIENSGAAVGYQVANIISIRVAGEANNTANIRQFSTERYFHGSQNVNFLARIENAGNVLVRPSGPLEIYNMLGQKVDTLNFNDSQNAVFPANTRDFTLAWEGEGVGFGRYEAIISLVYGDEGVKQTISSTVSFWVLPMNIIGPALGILAFILILTFIFVRLYIRRTLAGMSSGGTRIVRRRKKSNSSATLLLIVSLLTVSSLFLIVLLVLFA
jgi:hypothetical protein